MDGPLVMSHGLEIISQFWIAYELFGLLGLLQRHTSVERVESHDAIAKSPESDNYGLPQEATRVSCRVFLTCDVLRHIV